ncbi:MAG: metal-dependent phosphohydrolase [Planctomycetaceae bacterium]|nr:metal-dependent phosphohydrolase [Planctomycetaceae bacterium]
MLLAAYAMPAAATAGRVHPEPTHAYRNPYQRDRDRIVHSSAFRRLAHTTQVFTGEMGDYHRSRLTHTLEVASIARTVARTLRLNEDLAEALALAHDMGHPPFGHAGEDVLDECLAREGGFNHNRQGLRIVELLERRYPDFPGLNLSLEVLDGQRTRAEKTASDPQAPAPLLECQAVDAADSIAYDAHDADDAVELGLLELATLEEIELWQHAGRRARARYATLDDEQFRRAAVHELIDLLVGDLLTTSRRQLESAHLASVEDVRRRGRDLVGLSADLQEQKAALERLLFQQVYRHPVVVRQRAEAGAALREMFAHYAAHPERLPKRLDLVVATEGPARAAGDYLAGLTDRGAWEGARQLRAG